MKMRSVRAFLAIAVVGVFMAITATMALFPLFSPSQVQLSSYADFFAKTSSVYTGIVGVIIGYYFGRSSEAPSQQKPDTDEARSTPPDGTPTQ
jgi:ABC-type Fe3+-siderophore transport system permease subunit